MKELVLIGFGSNLGNSIETCRSAIGQLRLHPGISVVATSSLYQTKPLLLVDQPWFINGVVMCETDFSPEQLLDVTQQIERYFGRDRKVRWGPRTLDLDLLTYGDLQIDLPSLTIPHPQLHRRRFVLIPLHEIAPKWVHPILKLTAHDLLTRIPEDDTDQEVIRLEIP